MEARLASLTAENTQLRARLESTSPPPAAARVISSIDPPPAAAAAAAPLPSLSAGSLKDEWRRHVQDLETLLSRPEIDLPQIENRVNLTLILGRQLFTAFKIKHAQEMDFVVYATYACFGHQQQQQDQSHQGETHHAVYWNELTRDLDLSAELCAQGEAAMREYAEELSRLKQEQSVVSSDLAQCIRGSVGQLFHGIDAASVHSYSAKLAQLQRNYEAHWKAWEKAMHAVNECFSPLQRAKLIVRRKHFLENCATFNQIWRVVNRQPPASAASQLEWEPTLASLVPLPFHLCHSFPH